MRIDRYFGDHGLCRLPIGKFDFEFGRIGAVGADFVLFAARTFAVCSVPYQLFRRSGSLKDLYGPSLGIFNRNLVGAYRRMRFYYGIQFKRILYLITVGREGRIIGLQDNVSLFSVQFYNNDV